MSSSPDSPETPVRLRKRLANFFWQLVPNCREVARLTSEGRERALPLGTRLKLGLHRCFCTWCARYAKQLDLLGEGSQQFPEHLDQVGDQTLTSNARERMKRALEESRDGA
jgi:hypothetical protein